MALIGTLPDTSDASTPVPQPLSTTVAPPPVSIPNPLLVHHYKPRQQKRPPPDKNVPLKMLPWSMFTVELQQIIPDDLFKKSNGRESLMMPQTSKFMPFKEKKGKIDPQTSVLFADNFSPADSDTKNECSSPTSKSGSKSGGFARESDSMVTTPFKATIDDGSALNAKSQGDMEFGSNTENNGSGSDTTKDAMATAAPSTTVNSQSKSVSETEHRENLSSTVLSKIDKTADKSACDEASMKMFLGSPLGSECNMDECMSTLSDSDGENEEKISIPVAFGVFDNENVVHEKVTGRCFLMEMPREVRYRIYDHYFPRKNNGALVWTWTRTGTRTQTPLFFICQTGCTSPTCPFLNQLVDPVIFALNSTIYTDVARFFFSRYHFRFHTSQLNHCHLGAKMFSWMKNIEIEDSSASYDFCAIERILVMLSSCKNLKNIFLGPNAANQLWYTHHAVPNCLPADLQPVVPAWVQCNPHSVLALPKVLFVQFRRPLNRSYRQSRIPLPAVPALPAVPTVPAAYSQEVFEDGNSKLDDDDYDDEHDGGLDQEGNAAMATDGAPFSSYSDQLNTDAEMLAQWRDIVLAERRDTLQWRDTVLAERRDILQSLRFSDGDNVAMAMGGVSYSSSTTETESESDISCLSEEAIAALGMGSPAPLPSSEEEEEDAAMAATDEVAPTLPIRDKEHGERDEDDDEDFAMPTTNGNVFFRWI